MIAVDDYTRYTEAEFMISQTARQMRSGQTAFIGYGLPQIAAILAQENNAPDLVQVYEFGAIGPKPLSPFVRFTMGGPTNCYQSLMWTNMNTIFAQAGAGYLDIGVLGATQIDPYGNINSTIIGDDYFRPKRRFPGSGGGNEVASFCAKTVVIIMHEKRRFVEKLDFMTSPGFLDGSEGARERAGLPAGTGPWRVVTSKALFGYAPNRRMQLIGVRQDLTVEEVVSEMGFEPEIADEVVELEPPTETELRLLRAKIDPDRVVAGRGEIVEVVRRPAE
ncbi:MAG: acyl CoA--acetate/3-ketoacid CoA transferase subunit beta [Caldilineae bacterium]|nr:MAG: acyl CoA--acetate/3-ketoacid CoA transferase subunit beta [Caldilineae bacterium]